MNTEQRRLALYVALTLGALLALELFVRIEEPLFRAVSHRALAKAALLDKKPPTELLFFGTSRSWDGISARLFAEEFAERTHASIAPTAFNLATTGSSLETLEYLTERFAARPGLKIALIELSLPQLKLEPLPWEAPPVLADSAEERLQAFARRHVKLIELRSMFVGENFARMIPLLFFASKLDGSEVNPKDYWQEARGIFDARVPESEHLAWHAKPIDPTAELVREVEGTIEARLAAIVRRFAEHGVRVVFYLPPLSTADAREEHNFENQHLIARISQLTKAPILDFIAATDDTQNFRDTSHLNRRGRVRFSQALARALVEAGVLR